MVKFANLLVEIYAPFAKVQLVSPAAIATRFPCIPSKIHKYVAYIDKLLIFPCWLILNSYRYQLIHIADHGNAVYSFFCPHARTLVTCHDLLAVRGAMGDRSVVCNASSFGPLLQRCIVSGLRHADSIIFVSNATYRDYLALTSRKLRQRCKVIPNTLNAPFTHDSSSLVLNSDESYLVPQNPYLLMVGSSLPRKNRHLALQILIHLGENSPYSLVLSGAPLTADESLFQNTNLCGKKVISIPSPSHRLLNLLYCKAHALLFPSYSEGFGWPLIEAQASGCPIIASNTTCIPEVAGLGALYSDPDDVLQFIAHIKLFEIPEQRLRIQNLGLENIKRFDFKKIASEYHSFSRL
ncbi:glycosyltransferase family 4 protein [Synechococcus sp. CS-1331]|uniref:glycosyltransferase family 4 protein n=1 Tax=Synechococcus sp. CS-1331 TaxID=2847973 RepID=UPI00223A8262|nr:glycosyltransferase family 1 protein [Synechococcus sp. CS-1331]MCT0227560.1 glycosyltransferase family 4 protein [Synechococcus sp. CS-1331]